MDWNRMGKAYESVADSLAGPPSSANSSNRATRIYNRFVNFLLADFPPRATFVAGLVLGLRIG